MLRVVDLGTIVPDPHFVSTKLGQNYFLPNGFSIDRSVFNHVNESKNTNSGGAKKAKRQLPVEVNPNVTDRSAGHPSGLYFTATISAKPQPQAEGDAADAKKVRSGPLYTITRSDAPTEKRYEGESSGAVWLQAVAESERDFADRLEQLVLRSPGTEKSSLHGMDLFGVYLPDVVQAVAGLKGAAEAATAIPVKPRKAKEKAAPAAPAKTGKKSVSPPKDKESTLLSDLLTDGSQPTKRRKRSSASGAGKTTSPTPVPADGEAPERTPASTKKPRKSAAKEAASAPSEAPCPDCGLVNTPFCAATGKPHVVSVCPKCGLSSAFCPVTGEAHSGVVQRENRRRGEVRLPGAKRSSRKKAAAATDASGAEGDVHEVTVVTTQQTPTEEAPKKRRRSRAKAAEGGESVVGEGGAAAGEGGAPKKRRTRSKKSADAAVVPGTDGAPALEGTAPPPRAAAAAPVPPEPPVPEEPKEYEYPPLRPPMSNHESSRALHLMQKALREQPDQQHLPACVAALRMPFITLRVKCGNTTSKKRSRKSKTEEDEGKMKQEDKGQKDNDARDNDNDSNNGKDHNEDDGEDGNKEGAVDDGNEGQQNKEEMKGAATQTISVHPLEVRDVGTSLSGKRYMKFMAQYTSERTKLDTVRKNGATAATRRGRQKSAAPEAGAEGSEETKVADATTAPLGDRSDDISTVQLSTVKLEEEQPTPPPAPVEKAQPEASAEDIAVTQKIS